ncbi:MAG: hypothetical protein LC659_14190 [Myxococcales bacterium]|nr:hypothetical protein [Myxococcales bacterium]
MKLHRLWLALALGAGCGLVNSNTFSYDYKFDPPQGFMESFGDSSSTATVPMVACDPMATTDQCAALVPPSMLGAAKLSCDPTSRMCAAVVDVRLAYPVDLSMQSLPPQVVQYGADKVSIEKIAYWIMNKTVNVDIPPIDLYVAAAAAKDENDASAKLVGTVSKLPATATACTDAADPDVDQTAKMQMASVCDVKLTDTGQSALAAFVKDYKTPFQLIAHTKVVAHAGDPLPTGQLSFYVRPWVKFSVLQ